jgi:hypothetical protein
MTYIDEFFLPCFFSLWLTLTKHNKKLELRESDVSPCEQYSLGEMARIKNEI